MLSQHQRYKVQFNLSESKATTTRARKSIWRMTLQIQNPNIGIQWNHIINGWFKGHGSYSFGSIFWFTLYQPSEIARTQFKVNGVKEGIRSRYYGFLHLGFGKSHPFFCSIDRKTKRMWKKGLMWNASINICGCKWALPIHSEELVVERVPYANLILHYVLSPYAIHHLNTPHYTWNC